jgi:ABC-2 type transport system ATP-binding protein
MQHVMSLQGVHKTYGTSRGVQDISLTVPEGMVLGFLGPNGAGKTTTISMLINLTQPTSGSITIFGMDTRTHGLDIRKRIGFLAGDMALDKSLSGAQQLAYFAALRGGVDPKYVRELAKRLQCDLSRKIKQLSRGNRQKVALIAALMHKPDLLILDEPTSGLDPLIQAEFNKIILEHKAAGKTAFISSHVLSEVQELCDRIVIVREGAIVADKSLAELQQAAAKQIQFVTADKPIPYVTGLKGVSHLRIQGNRASFTYNGDMADLLHKLAKAPVQDITIETMDLEAIFMKYYEADVHA